MEIILDLEDAPVKVFKDLIVDSYLRDNGTNLILPVDFDGSNSLRYMVVDINDDKQALEALIFKLLNITRECKAKSLLIMGETGRSFAVLPHAPKGELEKIANMAIAINVKQMALSF